MRCWTRWRREAAQGSPAPSIPPTRTVDGANELATALHHSAQRPKSSVVEGPSAGEVHETYDALRRFKARLPGTRPGLLPEPEPTGRAVTDGYVAAPVPLLVVASLAGGDVVDATTVSFLLRENLRRQKMEEEEKQRRRVLEEKGKAKEAEKMEAQMLQLSERIRNDMPLTDSEWAAWYRWQALSSSSGTKRKRRKKKKLPRGGRALRRHRQWQPRWFPVFRRFSRCVPFVCRHA